MDKQPYLVDFGSGGGKKHVWKQLENWQINKLMQMLLQGWGIANWFPISYMHVHVGYFCMSEVLH